MKAINGYFISFKESEKKDIDIFLENEGYTADDDGIKNFLLDCIAEDPPIEPPGEKLKDFIKNNPEIVFRTVQGARGLFKYIKSLKK